MELVSYYDEQKKQRVAFRKGEQLYPCNAIHPQLPQTKSAMLAEWRRHAALTRLMAAALYNGGLKRPLEGIPVSSVRDVQTLLLPDEERVK